MNRFLVMSMVLLCAGFVRAEDWPAWRGPRLDGSSREKNLPLKWSVTKDPQTNEERLENIIWRTPITGLGHSSPIVSGHHIFLTTCFITEKKRMLLSLSPKNSHTPL